MTKAKSGRIQLETSLHHLIMYGREAMYQCNTSAQVHWLPVILIDRCHSCHATKNKLGEQRVTSCRLRERGFRGENDHNKRCVEKNDFLLEALSQCKCGLRKAWPGCRSRLVKGEFALERSSSHIDCQVSCLPRCSYEKSCMPYCFYSLLCSLCVCLARLYMICYKLALVWSTMNPGPISTLVTTTTISAA